MKLQVGMKVKIQNNKDYLEDAGKVKTITKICSYFNQKRAFELDNENDKIFCIVDFEEFISYPKLSME